MSKPKVKLKPKATDEGFVSNVVFPTHIQSRTWDESETNRDLREGIWRERALDPEGIYRSNASGTWHSKDNIFGRLGPAGERLHDMFGEAFVAYAYNALGADPSMKCSVKLSAWAMVYSDGGYAAVHTHPNCHASGVYYVDDTTADTKATMATGVSLKAGDIEFLDTRGLNCSAPNMKLMSSSIFHCVPGSMLVFQSNLPHYVHPVRGEGERIAIACNATYLMHSNPKETNL